MSTPTDGSPDNHNSTLKGSVQKTIPNSRGLGTKHSRPDPTTNETEKLLDLDGLLQAARLIKEVKKGGRLDSGGER